jgi:hypothetical protein
MAVVTASEARVKAEHVILEQKPFIIVTLENDDKASFLVHVGPDTLTDKQKYENRRRLDFNYMEFTNEVSPMVKVMWVMNDMKNKLKGEDNEKE